MSEQEPCTEAVLLYDDIEAAFQLETDKIGFSGLAESTERGTDSTTLLVLVGNIDRPDLINPTITLVKAEWFHRPTNIFLWLSDGRPGARDAAGFVARPSACLHCLPGLPPVENDFLPDLRVYVRDAEWDATASNEYAAFIDWVRGRALKLF